MADPKLVARLNSGPCCWRGRELTEVRLLWTVCYWESLLMAPSRALTRRLDLPQLGVNYRQQDGHAGR